MAEGMLRDSAKRRHDAAVQKLIGTVVRIKQFFCCETKSCTGPFLVLQHVRHFTVLVTAGKLDDGGRVVDHTGTAISGV